MRLSNREESWLEELVGIGDPELRSETANDIRDEIVKDHAAGDKVVVPCDDCDGNGCEECEFSGGVIGEIVSCKRCGEEGRVEVALGDQSFGMADCGWCGGQGRGLVTEP